VKSNSFWLVNEAELGLGDKYYLLLNKDKTDLKVDY
jgi:hypothetical protein